MNYLNLRKNCDKLCLESYSESDLKRILSKDKYVKMILNKNKEENYRYISYLKDINSFINTFNILNCDLYLRMFLYYPNIIEQYKESFLKIILKFINKRPKIIKYAKEIEKCSFLYKEFIWKCINRTMNILPYIKITNNLLEKIMTLNEYKINEFTYNIPKNKISDKFILDNINKCPRLIYNCSNKNLDNKLYIKKILHKTKFANNSKIIIKFLMMNNYEIIFDEEILQLINTISCSYLEDYVYIYNYNFNNINLIKKLLHNCCCSMRFYNIDYNNIKYFYELMKINCDCLDYIDFEKIVNKKEFLYDCFNINIYSIDYFIVKFKYDITLNMYKELCDINTMIINFIEDENIRNKIIIYCYKNNYNRIDNNLKNELLDIKRFHLIFYKKNISKELKKNIYSYLYSIE